MMAGAAYLHHVNLGRVLTLLAAILAVLGRLAAARLARALLPLILVRHLKPPPLSSRRGRELLGPSFNPRRQRSQAHCGMRNSDCGLIRAVLSSIRNPNSAFRNPHGACWTTMRTRSLPTWISSGLPSCMGMVLPLTLISSGGKFVAADAPVGVVALLVLVLAAAGGGFGATLSPRSGVGAAGGWRRRAAPRPRRPKE